MAASYEKAGVNLEAGYEVVRRIKQHVASPTRTGSMGNIKIAFAMDKHDTIGIDAVAMCVNDVLAQGAEPLIFLDYVALGHNVP